MNKLYSTSEVARRVGVTTATIINWEKNHLIPESTRIGLRRKRVWGEMKLKLILGFAEDNGYFINAPNLDRNLDL